MMAHDLPPSNLPEPRDELILLASRLADGQLADADRDRLATLLAEHPDLHQDYLRHLTVHAYLDWMHSPPELGVSASTPAAAQPHSPKIATWLRDLGRDFAREPVALAVLILVLISGGVLIWNLSQMGRPQQQTASGPGAASGEPRALARGGSTASGGASNLRAGSEHERTAQTPPEADVPGAPVVARLTRTVGATWSQQFTQPYDASLSAGQKLFLKQGLAEIAFESGVTVVLEGPAELMLGNAEGGMRKVESPTSDIPPSPFPIPHSNNACALSLGKLVARVPPQARGFTVQTPTMTVVDLGTEFGVAVKPIAASPPVSSLQPSVSSTTEVHVLLGEVRVIPEPVAAAQAPQSEIGAPAAAGHLKSEILKAGEAMVGGPAGKNPRRIQAQPGRFVRELPWMPLAPLATWPKDSPLKPGDIVAVTSKSMKVLKIDPKTGVQQLLAQGRPYGSGQNDHGVAWHCLAVAPDGTLVVGVDGIHGKVAGILRIDPRARTIQVLASGGLLTAGQVSGVAVAADGTIYAVYQTAIHDQPEHLLKIDPQSGAVSSLSRVSHAMSIGLDHQGRAMISAPQLQTVYLWDGTTATPWVQGAAVGKVFGVTFSPEGGAFFATRFGNSQRVLEIANGGPKTVATLASELNIDPPCTIAAEADGSLIVSNQLDSTARIYRVNAKSGQYAPVSSGEMLEPRMPVAVVPALPALSGKSPTRETPHKPSKNNP